MPGMIPRGILALSLLVALFSSAGGTAQEKPATPPQTPPTAPTATPQKSPDYSQEPLVVEFLSTRAKFENNGTGRIEMESRIRIQNDAGARALGELVFAYNSAAESLEISYARVRRADGSTEEAPAGNVQDLAAQAVRDAPLYSDAREKHVTVPRVRPGDTVEYQVIEIIQQPLIPGQFWFEHDFEKNAITLEQRLTLDVPAERALKIASSPGLNLRTEEANGRRIYSWAASHKARTVTANGPKPADQPDVRMSTFSSWEELGAWFQSVMHTGAAVTPEIQKKADELTQAAKMPEEKLEALYDYVALDFHSVSLAFGAARFEPHAVAAILKTGYADSIDKHALFAALAAAEGLRADAALVNSQRTVDTEVPSPAAFDHVITRVSTGSKVIWLDTTTEVAPFGFLISALRHKQALDIPSEGAAAFAETPADPPFPVHQVWQLEGSVSELGKLDAHVHYTLRGDNEVLLRLAFLRTPQAKWGELGQAIAASDGLRGDVNEVKPSDLKDTRHPFTLDYHVAVSGFFDWTSKRAQVAPPVPPLALPDATPSAGPLVLGSPAEVSIEMKLAVPARFSARAPVATSVARDYGEYRSSYSATAGVLSATRTLNIRQREIPAASAADYALFFHRAVRNDEAQSFTLESPVAATAGIPKAAGADDLVEAATRAYGSQKFALAEQLLERAVVAEPTHPRAWKLLGAVRLAQQENAQAIEAFRKEIELAPKDEFAYEGLGLAQAALEQYDDAIASFRKQLQVKPLDPMAQASLGATLGQAHRWAEAATELEKAVVLSPEDPRLYVNLGRAELNLEHADKAAAAFDKAVELDPSPPVWNEAAWELAQHNANLDRAQKFAELAVAGAEAELSNVTLEKLGPRDLAHTATLATYWDTLGWVCSARGELGRAERFASAAWRLDLRGEAADHLGQIYEKQDKKPEAARMYALALATGRAPAGTRERLEKLAGGAQPAEVLLTHSREDLAHVGEFSLPRLRPAGTIAAAEFFVLFGPGGHAEGVKLIRGDAELRGAEEKIRALDFGPMLPDETTAKLVRRGKLGCGARQAICTFTLIPAGQVRSVE
ncbi:MAG TPA: DUF3857 domain-containing protein [Candidatus Acidoferrales bacterium]|nr:DUF3857 domain-containing protein [Candidatus Acidoferrales bacterium]